MRLVEKLRDIDFWSLRPVYRFGMSSLPTHVLTVDMGGQVRSLVDYGGEYVGMPSTISDFEDEVDLIARSSIWINLTRDAIEYLKAEGYDFSSPAAGDMLARAIANEGTHDDEAMLSLIALGAPIDRPIPRGRPHLEVERSVIEEALLKRRAILIDPLIAKGALQTDGKPDQGKIDAAFRTAIRGGDLTFVQKIWEIAGDSQRPTLTFDGISSELSIDSDSRARLRKPSPVTLLLSPPSNATRPWDGLAIAKWLAAQGCDLKAAAADGTTLLQIATEAGHADFVRYLLDQGIHTSTPGRSGLPTLDSAANEEVALILLEAGADTSRMSDFRDRAEAKHWTRVLAWLSAHVQ